MISRSDQCQTNFSDLYKMTKPEIRQKKKKKMNGLLVKGEEKETFVKKKRNLVIKMTYQLSCTA